MSNRIKNIKNGLKSYLKYTLYITSYGRQVLMDVLTILQNKNLHLKFTIVDYSNLLNVQISGD